MSTGGVYIGAPGTVGAAIARDDRLRAEQEAARRTQIGNAASLSYLRSAMLEGTPATKQYEVNGRSVGQNRAAVAPSVDPLAMFKHFAGGGSPLMNVAAQQAISQLFPQGFTGTLGEGQVAFQDGREVARGPAKEQRKLPAEAELALWLTGGDESAARAIMQQRQNQAQADTGLNPIYGRDATGKVVIMQPTKSGQLVRSAVPDGVTPMAPNELAYDRAIGAASGQADAKRAAEAPGVIATAQNSLRNIRDLKNHPALASALGTVQGRLPALYGEQADVVSRIEQITGQAFLQAFDTLKGGGQITETEGAKATAAIARLNRIQSPKDFRAALTELETIIEAALERAQRGAMSNQPNAAPKAPGGWSIIRED